MHGDIDTVNVAGFSSELPETLFQCAWFSNTNLPRTTSSIDVETPAAYESLSVCGQADMLITTRCDEIMDATLAFKPAIINFCSFDNIQ